MLQISLFFSLHLLFAFPDLDITRQNNEMVRIQVVGEDTLLPQCIEGGFEVRYRYSLQICKRRGFWFDTCTNTRTIIHRLQYDDIREEYRITKDRHGDSKEPHIVRVSSLPEAQRLISQLTELPLHYIARDNKEYLQSKRSFISARVESICKGDYNETFERLSYFLTLGLIDISGFDSGWLDFRLPDEDG